MPKKIAITLLSTILCLTVSLLSLSTCQSTRNAQGEWLYNKYCSSCHMETGEGLQGVIPPLAGVDYLARERDQLACIIRYGQQGPIVVNKVTYNQAMAGVEELNDVEITNVINYIHQAWGNDLPYYPLDSVRWALEQCELRD